MRISESNFETEQLAERDAYSSELVADKKFQYDATV